MPGRMPGKRSGRMPDLRLPRELLFEELGAPIVHRIDEKCACSFDLPANHARAIGLVGVALFQGESFGGDEFFRFCRVVPKGLPDERIAVRKTKITIAAPPGGGAFARRAVDPLGKQNTDAEFAEDIIGNRFLSIDFRDWPFDRQWLF